LRTLLTELRSLFALIPKAKTAKIVRTVVDTIAKVPNSTAVQVRGNQCSFVMQVCPHGYAGLT